MKVIVTGGAGFIGSHVVDALVSKGHDVHVIDRLDRGKANIAHLSEECRFHLHVLDIKDRERIEPLFKNTDAVFHFAANADIRGGIEDTSIDLHENTIGTYNILENMRMHDVKRMVFASSAAVYGDPEVFPTPEDVPLVETSLYGASKVAGEAMIEAFCEAFGMQCWMFRFVSVVGPRHPHGVTYDFVNKLKKDPSRLEILGDGSQQKSFLHVEDCVDGVMHAFEHAEEKVNLFNLGVEEYVKIKDIADYVVSAMNLKGVKYDYTGGGRGWVGDQKFVFLSIDRIKALGWSPKHRIEDSIKDTVKWLEENPEHYKEDK